MSAPLLPSAVRTALDQLGSWVRDRFGPRVYRLALFGSFARGEGQLPDSDVDVLVAIDGMTQAEMIEIAQRAAEIGTDQAIALTPLPMSGEEFRELQRQQRLIAAEFERDGVAL